MNAPSLRHHGEEIAPAAFYAIACDPARSVAVEACAGAGKTWMLVSRIVRALLAGAQPHEILAITFTKKAAGEMRNRLHEWLSQWSALPPEALARELALRGVPHAGPAECARLRDLYAASLAAGRPVQVRTFHSWFAALLAGAPLSLLDRLQLPSRYELLLDDAEAVARVWRPFHIAVARDPQARADYEASVRAHGRSQTIKSLKVALDKRVEFALADAAGVVDESVAPMGQQFPEFAGVDDFAQLLQLSEVRSVLLAAASGLGRASAPTFSAKGAQLEQGVTEGRLEEVVDALLTEKGEARKFSEKVPDLHHVRTAQDLVARILAAQCQHEAWLHHGRTSRLARILLREFAQLKRSRGWIDMNDVERAANELLSDPVLSGWVQERLDARVRHLLIDEFQDTNPLQWQALRAWLESYAGAGAGAPSVFIVGDPKQSIYRFRRAEPQVFRAAQDFIVQGLGGDRLSCDHTRRNAQQVLQAVNTVFEAAQQAGEYAGFRAHTTQSEEDGSLGSLPPVPRPPRASAAAPPALQWRDSLTEPRELPDEKLMVLECRQAAAWIAQQLDNGRRPEDIMVLARKRDRLSALEDELRELHIAAQQPEKTRLGDAPEVTDLVALLDVLVSPDHDLSLAQALRSPLFGLGDEALVELATAARAAQGDGPPPSWFDLLQRDASLSPALREAGRTLTGWQSRLKEVPAHDALERIYAEADVLAKFAAAAPAALRAPVLANLHALLGAALEVRGGRYLTPYALVRALKSDPLPGPSVAAPGAVRLLTVHGAKGLESPVVLLLDTDGGPARPESMGVLCEWPGESAAPWRFSFIASETLAPTCCHDALRVEQGERHREELNALYVAMTRAQEELVISSVEGSGGEHLSWWARLSPLCAKMPPPEAVAAPRTADGHDAVTLLSLPRYTPANVPVAAQEPLDDVSPASRFGSAVHRLLETAAGRAQAFTPARLRRVAREFGLDDARLREAAQMAQRILNGEGAWAWDARLVDWQGNEVEVLRAGERLRLDRLVRRADTGEWWVLDYKSNASPERQANLVAQMALYRDAVAQLYPGTPVRLAFLTGQGKLVELA